MNRAAILSKLMTLGVALLPKDRPPREADLRLTMASLKKNGPERFKWFMLENNLKLDETGYPVKKTVADLEADIAALPRQEREKKPA